MRFLALVPPFLALGAGLLLVAPAPEVHGYSLLGGNLSTGDRDFRIFDNFGDPQANDNVTPDGNFPGYTGAALAIWKGCIEWGSELHGSGNGDPTQPGGLGSGGANFDPSFQGLATGIGTSSSNVHSEISSLGGGPLAYAESSGGTGWRIRYLSNWIWDDGPGAIQFGAFDLQGVGAHEYGHALGLGHSTVPGTTMFATTAAGITADRSIALDDQLGVQAIYGVKSATKPRIGATDVTGGVLTIYGANFTTNGNEVWFTQAGAGGSGTPVKLTGVGSSAGGTVIAVTIPGAAGPGDVLVKKAASGHASLSNAWPFDPNGGPFVPTVTGLTPSSIDVLTASLPVVRVDGNGFDTLLSASFDGVPLASGSVQLVSDTAIDLVLPLPTRIGALPIRIDTLGGSGTVSLSVSANATALVVANPPVMTNGQRLDVSLATTPGSILALLFSTDQVPSVLPGTLSLGIGNGFSSLWPLVSVVIPSAGWTGFSVIPNGIPPLSQFWLQALEFDAALTTPLPTSNVASVYVVF